MWLPIMRTHQTQRFADCRALDLSNPTIATSRLDEDERAKFNLGRQ